MQSETTYRYRQATLKAQQLQGGSDRYVDAGIKLRVVVQDEAGVRYVAGAPRLRILRTHKFGGMVDTRTRRFCGPTKRPVIWYCSEDQEPLLLHKSDLPPRLFAFGSEGAGKTYALAMYSLLRCLSGAGTARCFGATAPTGKRLRNVTGALKLVAPADWYTWNELHQEMRLVWGPTIQCVSTTRRSNDGGSPVQGYTWSLGSTSDEIQDSIDANPDIETRGRGCKGGRYQRLCTGTEKDSAVFRRFRDGLKNNSLWKFFTLKGRRSPFVFAKFWDDLKRTLSARDYKRRVEALPVGPERATYHAWDSQRNLRPIPIGAEDVTARELQRWGSNLAVLAGHDPGQIQNVTTLYKAYKLPRVALPVWWAIDEITTPGDDTDLHCLEVLQALRDKHRCNELDYKNRPVEHGRQVLVRADPCGDSDNKPDKSIYTIFRRHGMQIRPAAYNAKGTKPGRVPKNAGISVINGLIRAASGLSRLMVLCDDRQQPACPNLVEAFETSERDEHGVAEVKRKGFKDQSHWPATTRYAFWAIERPRMERLAA